MAAVLQLRSLQGWKFTSHSGCCLLGRGVWGVGAARGMKLPLLGTFKYSFGQKCMLTFTEQFKRVKFIQGDEAGTNNQMLHYWFISYILNHLGFFPLNNLIKLAEKVSNSSVFFPPGSSSFTIISSMKHSRHFYVNSHQAPFSRLPVSASWLPLLLSPNSWEDKSVTGRQQHLNHRTWKWKKHFSIKTHSVREWNFMSYCVFSSLCKTILMLMINCQTLFHLDSLNIIILHNGSGADKKIRPQVKAEYL